VKPQPTAPVPRIALTREEAAAALGVSLSHFERHIQQELRLVYSGSVRLVPIRELEAWAERTATLIRHNEQKRPPRRANARGPGPQERHLP
jgi:excisionase family DNA binding protein